MRPGLSSPRRRAPAPAPGHYSVVLAGAVYSYAPVNERLEDQARAKRALIVLYVLIAAGILLPFVVLWLKR